MNYWTVYLSWCIVERGTSKTNQLTSWKLQYELNPIEFTGAGGPIAAQSPSQTGRQWHSESNDCKTVNKATLWRVPDANIVSITASQSSVWTHCTMSVFCSWATFSLIDRQSTSVLVATLHRCFRSSCTFKVPSCIKAEPPVWQKGSQYFDERVEGVFSCVELSFSQRDVSGRRVMEPQWCHKPWPGRGQCVTSWPACLPAVFVRSLMWIR